MSRLSRVRRALADQRGFTMVSVMITMMLVGLFALGAYAAAQGDIKVSRDDQDRKRAFEAAQAGIEWYAFQLERDPSYWTKCTAVPNVATGVPAPVENPWNGVSARPWRTLLASDTQYVIDLMPANGTACSTSDPAGSMLDDGILTIRSTGRARGEKRSIVASFRRRSFVDFVYFTQWETLDPVTYTTNPTPAQAAAACNKKRSQRTSICETIQFPTGDYIRGPLHTNDDSIYVNGTPQFGRTAADKIEIAGTSPGWVGSGSPNFQGTRITPAGTLTMPPSNSDLAAIVHPDYRFTGNTCVRFNGANVEIWTNQNFRNTYTSQGGGNSTGGITCPSTSPTVTRPFPDPNGNAVLYVGSNASCTDTYDRYQRYDNNAGCGDVAIQGTYDTSLTIAAANDIIVRGDVKKTDGDDMLGLIANNFVRVYHPAIWSSSSSCSTSSDASGHMENLQIDAAILSLNHSFIVDNWYCGNKEDTLTVNGAIAQYYRGTVGTSGGGGGTGYLKNYQYDDRLKYKEPPNFLNPVQTKWNLVRRGEQQPAR